MKTLTTNLLLWVLSLHFAGDVFAACCAGNGERTRPRTVTITRAELLDKIKGGWAGQTIGVTYGFPTEFRYTSGPIDDDIVIPWGDPDYIRNTMTDAAGAYDDVYMDLTFVEVIDRLGIDAPADSMAAAFANAGYPLWHANQAARYNILNGIMPPASGHWLNNPHADDIDFQIEADFAGLMSPAMPQAAAEICDRAGHIMNYGDGWYGGVYMAAMYTLAFVSSDVEYIVTEGLKVLPPRSAYRRCIEDVVEAYRRFPDDWHAAWEVCRERWDNDTACGDGALLPFNIDAKINGAYVVIGLLYGGGDFGRTIDIATRCGQDSDCNPASAAGILGTAIGYDSIPDAWRKPLERAEDLKFAYTDMSLADVYRTSYGHAMENILRNGGTAEGGNITIRAQKPRPVQYEQSFGRLRPVERRAIESCLGTEYTLEAECDGIVIRGEAACGDTSYGAHIEVEVDGRRAGSFIMPADWNRRRHELWWDFDLGTGRHRIVLRWKNPRDDASVYVRDALLLRSERK